MPRIAYVSWPATEITGGIKMTFRHVETLRAEGWDAVVATADGAAPEWFATTAPVVRLEALREERAESPGEGDTLVFPENHRGLLERFAPWRNRKAVFCQNHFMVLRGLGKERDYGGYGVTEILVPGHATADFCRLRFPRTRVHVVHNYADPAVFRPSREKTLRIVCMPRKRPLEVAVVHDLFRTLRPEWANVPWVTLADQKEPVVAQVLSESAVALSLCRMESFSLSLLESMASGCIVAGFTGIGGREIAHDGNGFWAPEDDCVAAAEQLVRAVQVAVDGGPRLQARFESALATTLQFDRGRFVRGLVRAWTTIGVPRGTDPRPPAPAV